MKKSLLPTFGFLSLVLVPVSASLAAERQTRSGATVKSQPSEDAASGQTRSKVEKKGRSSSQRRTDHSTFHSTFGIGLELGANSTYGNGVKLMFDPVPFFDFQAAMGYNSTGFKAGGGAAVVLPLGDRFGMNVGAAAVYSAGTQGKVSLPAKFTPEGGEEENITVTRKFRATPATFASPFFGGYFSLTPMFRLAAQVNYNHVFKGNNIDLSEDAEYDTPVEPTNEADVNTDFEKRAKEKLNINGLGISAGLQLRF